MVMEQATFILAMVLAGIAGGVLSVGLWVCIRMSKSPSGAVSAA